MNIHSIAEYDEAALEIIHVASSPIDIGSDPNTKILDVRYAALGFLTREVERWTKINELPLDNSSKV